MIDSLRGLLRDDRVQTALVCLGILLLIGAAFVPVGIWNDAPDNAEPAYEHVEFPENGSYTVSYEYTTTTKSGYVLTFLTDEPGFIETIPGNSDTVTETLTYDAERDIAHAKWEHESRGITAELYASNGTMYWRVSTNNTAKLDQFAGAYKNKENVTVVRDNSTNSVSLVFNEVMPAWKPRPSGFAFAPSWSSQFKVVESGSSYELVKYQTVTDVNGNVQTNKDGIVTEITATEHSRPLAANTGDGKSVPIWTTKDMKKTTFMSTLVNPTQTASLKYKLDESASITETPEWVTVAQQAEEN